MEKFNKALAVALTLACLLGITEPFIAHAATTPSLGAATTYGVLSDTYTNPAGPTTILGDVGFTTGPGVIPLGGHPSGTYPNYGSGAPYSTAGTDQASALVNLNSQGCTFSFLPGAIDLSANGEHLPTYAPGVYCIDGDVSIGTAITLDGSGTYIFRSNGSLVTASSSIVALAGAPAASACDVFWTPNGAATLNANSTFIGTVIPVSQDITVLSTTSWIGRALTFLHTVTTPDSNVTITVPSCTPPILHLRKLVTNDNGGTATLADFLLTANGTGANDISGTSPVDSGAGLLADTFALSETSPAGYTASSWVCVGGSQVGSNITLLNNEEATCTIMNDDIVPSLTLNKTVVNDSGGTALASGWILTAAGPTGFSGAGPTVSNGASFDTGTYDLSETGPAGYIASDWICVGGTQIDNDTVSISLNESVTCTITNNDIAPTPTPSPTPSSGNGSSSRSSRPFTVVDPILIPDTTPAVQTALPTTPAPGFPKTGFPPKENYAVPPVIIFGFFVFSIFIYFDKKKQTA